LAEDNLEAADLLAANAGVLRQGLSGWFGPIERAVQEFDCPGALVHLKAAAGALEIPLNLSGDGV
jgi:hypothetical protein